MYASLRLSNKKVPLVNRVAASLGERRLASLFLEEIEDEGSSLNLVRLLMVVCGSFIVTDIIISLSKDQISEAN